MEKDSRELSYNASLKYFEGNELAASTFVSKYMAKKADGEYERTPDEMHHRIANEYARIEEKFGGEHRLSEDDIYGLFKDFKYIIPGGSVMGGLGNDEYKGSLSNCFVKGTKIHTLNRGVISIEDAEIGDVVVSEDGSAHRVIQLHKTPVSKEQEIVKFKCYRTPSILCTGNHKFLSISKEQIGWGINTLQKNTISYLRAGDYIAIPNMHIYEQSNITIDVLDYVYDGMRYGGSEYRLSEEKDGYLFFKSGQKKLDPIKRFWKVDSNFCYFLGLWYGDGCVFSNRTDKVRVNTGYSRKNSNVVLHGISFTFSKNEKALIDFVLSEGKNIFGKEGKHNDSTHDNSSQVIFHSGILGCVFEQLFGSFSAHKFLPNFLNDISDDELYSLLSGLVDSDGTITKAGNIRVVLNNGELIESFYHLARSRGICLGKVACKQKNPFTGNNTIVYRLDFDRSLILLLRNNKFYEDNRIYTLREKTTNLTAPFIKKLDGHTLVKITDKEIFSGEVDYVYNIGVEDVHSYTVEGLVCMNCFVIGQCEDSYASIMKYRDYMVELEKRRGGVGIDLSKLRPSGTFVNNAAKTSTGPVSFMNGFSEISKEVAQDGRRGALMISISGDHPDIEQFIECKQDLTKITGANISVKFSDKFMKAVQNDEDYYLHWPVDVYPDFPAPFEYNVKYWSADSRQCAMKVRAKDVWNKFVHCAWNTAEPGIMYEDKHYDLSPDSVYPDYKGVTTNPCVTGDTLVMTDRGEIILTELLERFNKGEQFSALTFDVVTEEFTFEKITNVIKTRENAEIMSIRTFGGSHMLKLTPDHKVYVQDKGYVEAKDINRKDVLVTIPLNNDFVECIKKHDDLPNEDVYDITVENNHNFFANGILVHNCGEIFMGPFDSCRLMHLNLPSFVRDDKTFDYELLEKVAYQNMQLCDDLVELELEHVQQIIDHIKSTYIDDNRNELELWEKIYKTGSSSRRAGCGATGVADTLALLDIKLNSEEGFKTIEKIFQTKMLGELKAQIDMAKERGTFVGYDFSKEYIEARYSKYISLHSMYVGTNAFYDNLLNLPGLTKEMMKEMKQYGRRNVSWSTMAPVGTGAIMTQGSSGIEPVFKLLSQRRKKVSSSSDRVDYVDEAGEKFTVFNVIHIPFKKWAKKNLNIDLTEDMEYSEVKKYVEQSPWYGCEAEDLSPEEHVRLQNIVQKYTTHSISKTCNLPSTVTENEVSEIYMLGWEQNCKGLTVYRDGCRSGVIIEKKEAKCPCENETTLTHSAPKRPKVLTADIKRFKNGGDKWIAFVGLFNGQPFEIFTGLSEKIDMPDYVVNCEIIKNKIDKEVYNEETGTNEVRNVSSYDIVYQDKNGNKRAIFDVGNIFRTEFDGYGRMISAVLRHGMPIKYVVSTIKSIKFNNETINSWKAGVIRALKTYIKNGDVHGEVCPECGGKLVRENGCIHCIDCGWSKCG